MGRGALWRDNQQSTFAHTHTSSSHSTTSPWSPNPYPHCVSTRAFQNLGFSAESGIYPDISGYIRWNLLDIQCESKMEDTAGKLILCFRLFVKRLVSIRCCCEQEAASYRTVLYPNHDSKAPGFNTGGAAAATSALVAVGCGGEGVTTDAASALTRPPARCA